MQEASLERPAKNTPLLALAGVVHADADTTYDALAELVIPDESQASSFVRDDDTRTLVLQGGWWYRGEYRVLPHEEGARVEHELVNVAQTAHWAGPITGRSVIADTPALFQQLLTDLADRVE
jgi:beta-glucanase (GH16 family)